MAEQSITINFQSEVTEEDQALVIELDSEMNDEKTSFVYGEKAYFKIYKYPSDLVVTIEQSDGTITEEGSGTVDEEEFVSFVDTESSSVSKPVKEIADSEWFGNDLGAVSATGLTVEASQSGVGVLQLNYTSDFTRHAITIGEKSEELYPIIVFILGEAAS